MLSVIRSVADDDAADITDPGMALLSTSPPLLLKDASFPS
jgi:hypothetical protein